MKQIRDGKRTATDPLTINKTQSQKVFAPDSNSKRNSLKGNKTTAKPAKLGLITTQLLNEGNARPSSSVISSSKNDSQRESKISLYSDGNAI